MNLEAITLSEVAEKIQYGYTASASYDKSIGPKYLRITDIVPDVINWEQVPYCKINDDEIDKYLLHTGDIVIARTGNTTGYAKLIRGENNAVFASYLIRVQVNKDLADPYFIGHLLESDIYKRYVAQQKSGSAQGGANAKVLTNYRFVLPPLPDQRKIASILSAYDDLIKNNLRRIALLGEAMRLLYQEWFVRLQFPGYEHTGIVDGVPEGWEQVTIEDVLTLQRGFDLPSQSRIEGRVPIVASTGINGFHDKAMVKGPGVVTGRSGSLGNVHYICQDFWPLNTTLWVKELKRVSPLFAYFLLKELSLEIYNGGVSVPTLDRKVVHRIPIVLPSEKVMNQFNNLVEPIVSQIKHLEEYNQKLKQARDLLLPKLMSGEVTV